LLEGHKQLARYRLSKLAKLDLIEIAEYTVDRWGLEQADRYLDSLSRCFELLVSQPRIGRPCDRIRKGYRRIEHEKHVIFYLVGEEGIFISRILHQNMLPGKHLFEDF